MKENRGVSRREFIALASASALAVAPGCRSEKTTTETPAASPDPLLELTAVNAVAKMRNGEVTAERYASALLERCQQGKALNAFITLPQDQVLEAARAADRLRASGAKLGALHGLPIPVKDSVNTKDMPTTGGTPALRNFRPKEDAPVSTQQDLAHRRWDNKEAEPGLHPHPTAPIVVHRTPDCCLSIPTTIRADSSSPGQALRH